MLWDSQYLYSNYIYLPPSLSSKTFCSVSQQQPSVETKPVMGVWFCQQREGQVGSLTFSQMFAGLSTCGHGGPRCVSKLLCKPEVLLYAFPSQQKSLTQINDRIVTFKKKKKTGKHHLWFLELKETCCWDSWRFLHDVRIWFQDPSDSIFHNRGESR